jgi:endonuclease YncB( thermonuclease family)
MIGDRNKAHIPFFSKVGALSLAVSIGLASPAWSRCQGEAGGESVVTAISGGDTLILEDGRAVRLMGILGPKRMRGAPATDATAKLEAAISAATLGKKVSLQLSERKRDRYGRAPAQVMIANGTGEAVWLQAKLVEAGLARVISAKDSRLCIKELLAMENEARQAKKGLWESGFFTVRSARDEHLLYQLSDNYEIVDGEVANITELGGKTYINFGQNWRQDFTIFVPTKSAHLFGETKIATPGKSALAELTGKRIRVRGWLKNFNGPSITVTHPEQIEIVSDQRAALR